MKVKDDIETLVKEMRQNQIKENLIICSKVSKWQTLKITIKRWIRKAVGL